MKLNEIFSIGLKLLALFNLFNLFLYAPFLMTSWFGSPDISSFVALTPILMQIVACAVLFAASNYVSRMATGSWGDQKIDSIQANVNWHAVGISLIAVFYLLRTLLRIVSRIQFDLTVYNEVAPTDSDWPIQSAIRILVCLALLKFAGPIGLYLRNLHDSSMPAPESSEDPAP